MSGARQCPFITERYRTDRRFQLELDYTAERGIPHSEFLGWDEEDQEKAIVWLTEQRLKCPDCGTREDEWNPKMGGELAAYHVYTYQCMVCKSIEDAHKDARIKDGKRKGQLPPGFKARLIPNHIWQARKRIRKQREILNLRKEASDKAIARRERQKTTDPEVI